MSGFDDRERAEEAKYSHDAELSFKGTARRDKLTGEWVASEFLGLSGEAAEEFGRKTIEANFEKPGDEDVIEFLLKAVSDAGGDLTEARLKARMDEFYAKAVEQLKAE